MIPTYNQAVFIREAVDSALAQTYSNIEVIVGDDASTDTTPDILAKISDPRLKYVRNAFNLGRVANYRNLLYNHSTGDYVVNLDGDDYYTANDFISDAVNFLDNQTLEVVMVVARATRKSRVGEWASEIPNQFEFTGMQIIKKLPQKQFMIMHMASLYSRKHAISTDFYSIDAISSDWESLYRLSLRGAVKFLNKNIGVWRIHEMNETRTTDPVKQLKNLTIWPLIYKEARKFGLNPLMADFICARCIAFFAQSGCVIVSKNGNIELVKYVLEILRRYKLASLLLLLTPSYTARLILCFLGYYRRKNEN
jgi:glycosyltransferase involved in cell wall biosynthesis